MRKRSWGGEGVVGWRTVGAVLSLAVAAGAGGATAANPTCPLFQPGAERVPTSDCMNCHGSATHPVDLDYAAAAARSHGSLRTSDEAVRRGAFLPAGQVKCVTCHDPRSPWKYKLALPPGARAVAAVDRSDATTYETPRSKRSPAAPAPGAAVSPTPLCTTCHAYGD